MRIEDMKGALPHPKENKAPAPPKTLTTVWGDDINPEHVREEYPRPRLVREGYICLNGIWDCEFTAEPIRPERFTQRILVPFSPESALSGVLRQLRPGEYLWYERQVPVPAQTTGERCLVHFEAADQIAVIFVNGKEVIRHTGGYLPFTADITGFLPDPAENAEEFTLTVCIQDFSDTSFHSRGKQKLSSNALGASAPSETVQSESRREGSPEQLARNGLDHQPDATGGPSGSAARWCPGGMYYTAQSGLWGSVWMEVVPARHLEDVLFETQPDRKSVHVTLIADGAQSIAGESGPPASERAHLRIYAPTLTFDESGQWYQSPPILEQDIPANGCCLEIPQPRLWSPDTPWLYPAEVRLGQDRVKSYLALRTFELEKDKTGTAHVLLNGEPVFLNGILNQGYWPDGLYTAPADTAFVYDILQMKALGFNMLRQHAKLECRRWYYHCDRLGMIVWQDMVNGGGSYSALLLTYLPTGLCVPGPKMRRKRQHSSFRSGIADGQSFSAQGNSRPLDEDQGHARSAEACGSLTCTSLPPSADNPDTDAALQQEPERKTSLLERLEWRITSRMDPEGRMEFRRECEETVSLLRGYPCIMTWVIFNEGWGQFRTKELTDFVRSKDPGRLIDSASGWFEHKTGDFKSVHNYFRPLKVPKDVRVNVLSEYGGYVYHLEGHSMFGTTYGYHTCSSQEEFERSFLELMTQQVLPLREQGLCGAVYTQVSDIEEETNGLLTYDRRICKISKKGAAQLREAFARRNTGHRSPFCAAVQTTTSDGCMT